MLFSTSWEYYMLLKRPQSISHNYLSHSRLLFSHETKRTRQSKGIQMSKTWETNMTSSLTKHKVKHFNLVKKRGSLDGSWMHTYSKFGPRIRIVFFTDLNMESNTYKPLVHITIKLWAVLPFSNTDIVTLCAITDQTFKPAISWPM